MRLRKRRYLALKAEDGGSCTARNLFDTVWKTVFQLFGEVGASKTGLSLVHGVSEREKYIIVRCFHSSLNNVRAAVSAVTDIDGKQAAIRVVAVSGTLKALRRKLGSTYE